MRGSNKANLIISGIFFLSICFPIFGMLFPYIDISPLNEEKRELVELPSFSADSLSSFPGEFERFFNDHFGFRNLLIRLNNLVRLSFFKSSGSPKVFVGKDGWLFYNGDQAGDGFPVANHLGILPANYKNAFLQRKKEFEAKKTFFSELGIRYVVVIVPDKWSVYPEYLPNGYANTDRKSNSDLLVEYLKLNTDIDLIYLKEVMVDEKQPEMQLYYKYGTHWNDLGAYFGYREIAKSLSKDFPHITPRRLDEFDIVRKTGIAGDDLAKMLSLGNYFQDTYYDLSPKKPYCYINMNEGASKTDLRIYRRNENELPRALVVGDSFMESIIPFLSDDFSAVAYMWRISAEKVDIFDLLRMVKPNIVIEECAERYLVPINSLGKTPQ